MTMHMNHVHGMTRHDVDSDNSRRLTSKDVINCRAHAVAPRESLLQRPGRAHAGTEPSGADRRGCALRSGSEERERGGVPRREGAKPGGASRPERAGLAPGWSEDSRPQAPGSRIEGRATTGEEGARPQARDPYQSPGRGQAPRINITTEEESTTAASRPEAAGETALSEDATAGPEHARPRVGLRVPTSGRHARRARVQGALLGRTEARSARCTHPARSEAWA